MLSVQILIAKSPVAPFTTFVYTIEKEGLVLQGPSLVKSKAEKWSITFSNATNDLHPKQNPKQNLCQAETSTNRGLRDAMTFV
ncbi:DNA repair protein RAD51-like protein 2 [Camelus dromedarius]|uniref:DNA repair protein RAD51-like protein 2 n=1 Tax=Camelus dromedarius TaxID=9838 RepID=A0A5N4E331_CAMDR|nr:DNA repair protein RAD51-like protein 2 [Camelus dromedarius]